MIYSPTQLHEFWQSASAQTPVIILGGGRWGRVWSRVLVNARGSAANLGLVSREHADEVIQWRINTPNMSDLYISSSLDRALAQFSQPAHCIIASRPSDHVRDARAALEHGCNVLIEKPLSDDTASARDILALARARGLRLGVATEFAFLPALHFIAGRLAQDGIRCPQTRLHWTDPAGEIRHDQTKRDHSEITALEDIVPHAVSLIHILVPGAELELSAMTQIPKGGAVRFHDTHGGNHILECDMAGHKRARFMEINTDTIQVTLDFAQADPIIFWNDDVLPLPHEFSSLNSTLRLEFGAFLASLHGLNLNNPLLDTPHMLLRLHDALRSTSFTLP